MNRERIEELLADGKDGGRAVWNALLYDRDGIVEASAGTGKTFTLQRIVLKLVSDPDETRRVNVRNILLVTFTDKAAGELKDRIRRILDEAGCLTSDFAETTICTIHSFCRELLSSFAFGNGVPMRFDIAGSDDDPIHRAVLAALRGDKFRTKFAGNFDAYMLAAGLDTADALAAKAEERLGAWAKRGDPPEEPRRLDEAARRSLAGLAAALDLDLHGLVVNGRARPGFEAAVQTVRENAAALRSDDFGAFVAAVAASASACSKLNPSVNGQGRGVHLFDVRPDLGRFASAVQGAAEILADEMPAGLAGLAWPDFLRLKAESSALTFDDLVAQASRAVAREAEREERGVRSELLDAIRRRYRIALVDEFQDTDQRQWDIFRRIFSYRVNRIEGADAPEPRQGFLLVVGDPKQAIYGWRGADVATYLAAKEFIESGDGAQPALPLDKAWRSSRELTDAFNTVFGEPSGWFGGMTEGGRSIEYRPVAYPEGNGRFRDLADFTGRPSVNLLESLPRRLPDPKGGNAGYGNQATCLPVFLENAAREMKRLRGLDPAYTTTDDKGNLAEHRIRFRDMCVLVRGHAGAQTAQRILSRHGIPYAYYKEAGLFATEEAESILALFDFLSAPGTPGNLAALLLTPLFGVRPADLGRTLAEGGNEHSRLLDEWQGLAAKRDWSKLFESVMDDTLLARPAAGDFGFDRRWTAFRQILDGLLAEQGRSALSVADFAALLRSWCANDRRAGENGSLRQKESDGDRVQIMTMHAAKGLEFKAVFVAAGWSEGDEDENADKRLYYVALTRAEHKLYLPWTQWSPHRRGDRDEPGVGSKGSPLLGDGFFAKGILAFLGGRKETVLSPADAAGAASDPGTPGGEGGGPPPKLYGIPYLKNRRIQWDSFSTLAGGGSSRRAKAAGAKTPDEPLLSRNNVSGTVFHEIMQELCENGDGPGEAGFAIGRLGLAEALEDAAFAGIVQAAMRRHAVGNQERGGDSTARTLMRMAWAALNAEIRFEDGSSFLLRDVPAADRHAEVEFAVDQAAVFGADLPPLGGRRRTGAFNGSIDLLVRPKGRQGPVYILDWKTNSLEDFGDKAVAAEMAEARYDLQFKLYSLAVRQWLGKDALGGVAYLFVRGGEDGTPGKVGIYARAMGDALAADCRETVRKALPGAKGNG